MRIVKINKRAKELQAADPSLQWNEAVKKARTQLVDEEAAQSETSTQPNPTAQSEAAQSEAPTEPNPTAQSEAPQSEAPPADNITFADLMKQMEQVKGENQPPKEAPKPEEEEEEEEEEEVPKVPKRKKTAKTLFKTIDYPLRKGAEMIAGSSVGKIDKDDEAEIIELLSELADQYEWKGLPPWLPLAIIAGLSYFDLYKKAFDIKKKREGLQKKGLIKKIEAIEAQQAEIEKAKQVIE